MLAPRRQALHRQVAAQSKRCSERLQELRAAGRSLRARRGVGEGAGVSGRGSTEGAASLCQSGGPDVLRPGARRLCTAWATVEPATLLRLYAGKGAVHFLRSEFLPSINAYQRLREVARQLGDRAKEAEALYQISSGYHRAHEIEHALDYAEQAKALALEIDAKNILAGASS